MPRTLAAALALIVSTAGLAAAQPAPAGPSKAGAAGKAPGKGPGKAGKRPASDAPVDPYASPPTPTAPADPVDPYAAPTTPAPPTSGPVDPYAAPTAPLPGGAPAAAAVTVPDPCAGKVGCRRPAGALASPSPAPVDPYGPTVAQAIPARVGLANLGAVQGLLAVAHLDGWLLWDRDGQNPIADRVVAPTGHPQRPWFYLIPAQGQPVALIHSSEVRSFDHVPGRKITYQGYRDLDPQLRAMFKGVKSVAAEYSPKAAVPGVSRIDAGTLEVIRAAGVQVRSSDTLVTYAKAIWGDAGRTAHYVAVHHLVELRQEALGFVAAEVAAGRQVSEYDVQQRLIRGMKMRGLDGPPPTVAAGVNSADPYYAPTAERTRAISRGDVLVLSLAAKVDRPDGVYAAQTWVAVVGDVVPAPVAKAFDIASLARDQALALITDRSKKHRPVTGAEVDQVTRAFIKKAGMASRVLHRTGHSLDNDLQGGGADLDDFEVKDTRILTPGTGFTVGPGLYFAGEFGVRSEVSVFLAPGGPEVTTPAQDDVEALLKP
jgi:Xaa-Pro aminopeptidase